MHDFFFKGIKDRTLKFSAIIEGLWPSVLWIYNRSPSLQVVTKNKQKIFFFQLFCFVRVRVRDRVRLYIFLGFFLVETLKWMQNMKIFSWDLGSKVESPLGVMVKDENLFHGDPCSIAECWLFFPVHNGLDYFSFSFYHKSQYRFFQEKFKSLKRVKWNFKKCLGMIENNKYPDSV